MSQTEAAKKLKVRGSGEKGLKGGMQRQREITKTIAPKTKEVTNRQKYKQLRSERRVFFVGTYHIFSI